MQQLLHPSFKPFNPFAAAGRLPKSRIIETHERPRAVNQGKRICHYWYLYLWSACPPFCFRLNIFLTQIRHSSIMNNFLRP